MKFKVCLGASQVQQGSQEGQQQQQQQRPGGWAIIKTLVVRCVFIYMISSFFRRGTTPPPATTEDGQVKPGTVLPSRNIYIKDMPMVSVLLTSSFESICIT